jgi:hypothetical protein
MRRKAEKLFAKLYSAQEGGINLIMKAFEDVAVNFAWRMLKGHGCRSDVTIDQIKSGFRDYATPLPFRPSYEELDSDSQYDMMERLSEYPPYKTPAEIVKDRMSRYYHKRYYKCAHCAHSFLDVGVKHCPKCNTTHLYHITPAGYEKERARLRKPVKQNYVQGISKYYKCQCCDHTFLSINPRYCPECKSITFMPLFKYYEKKRECIRKQISKHYHKCPYCGHTYLGKDHCPTCQNVFLDLACGLDIQACRDREKFLNTYGYVARPGIDPDVDCKSSYDRVLEFEIKNIIQRNLEGLPEDYHSPTVADVKNLDDCKFLWHMVMEEGIKKIVADKQTPSLREQGFYNAQDVCDAGQVKGLPVGYISHEDMDYLWECMPAWIKKETPLTGAEKIRNKKVKRILCRI